MRIVFQGDSITDCHRGDGLGTGYAFLCAAALGREEAVAHEIYNRGVGGHRIVDLLAHWRRDGVNLKPDYLSILVGVNDVWHELHEDPNGVPADLFEKIYDIMLEETFRYCPDTTVVLMEPYVTHGKFTNEKWDIFDKEVALRREAVRRLAKKYQLPLIPLQQVFDDAITEDKPAPYWTVDGVHPTPAGHALIAEQWLKTFRDLKG